MLVLTKQGLWLVEIKSRPGRVEGDAGTWTWADASGRRVAGDGLVLMAERKGSALSSAPEAEAGHGEGNNALVYQSEPAVQVGRPRATGNRVAPTASRTGVAPDGGEPYATPVNRESEGALPCSIHTDADDLR